jgi:acetyl-CoA C-acetyltransferase
LSQTRDAAIVGIHEYPSRDVEGRLSPLQIKAESAARALEDAGLEWSDVDAIYDAGEGGPMSGLTISEYFGLTPRVIDTTNVGGSSYEYHAAHARRDIAAGKARVALLTYGSTAHSNMARIGVGGRGGLGVLPADNMESFVGMTLVANYAMAARRHMYEYGTTSEQLAEISVATRLHAMRNPEAVKAMEDLEFLDIRETTIGDVVSSRMIADPLHLLECCMISDGGGAVVIAAPEVARNCAKPPVWILGTGEATKYPENGGDITTSAAAQSGPEAFGEAGINPSEVDIAMIYDSFSITVLMLLEDLGFCPKGEGGRCRGRSSAIRPARRRPRAQHRRRRIVVQPPWHARHIPAHRGGPAAAWRIHEPGGQRKTGRGPWERRHAGKPALRRHRDSGEGLIMTDAKRPLPSLNELDTQPFWEATRGKALRYQKCSACGTVIWHPRAHCTGCTGGGLDWHTASGNGVIYSFSVVRQSYHPFFRTLVPYAIAWIDLDEGPRVLSNIVGVVDPTIDLACGQRVTLTWEEHEELNIPLFTPA